MSKTNHTGFAKLFQKEAEAQKKNLNRKKFLSDPSDIEEDTNEPLKFMEYELLPMVPAMRETYNGPMVEIGKPNPYNYIEQQHNLKMLQTLQPSTQNVNQNMQSSTFLPPADSLIIPLPKKKKKLKKKRKTSNVRRI